jgi:hypothetical protein
MSRYVLVVLSAHILYKGWTRKEFDASIAQEAASRMTRVLPLLFGSDERLNAILAELPLLRGKRYLLWTGSPAAVVAELRKLLDSASDSRNR